MLRTMLDLICSLRHKSQLAGLGVLAGLAMTSPEAAEKLLSPKLHQVCPPAVECSWQLGGRSKSASAPACQLSSVQVNGLASVAIILACPCCHLR